MALGKGFEGFVESKSIRDAIDALIPWQVIVVVEGDTDWHWLHSKVRPKLARIEYRTGDDGGKEFVLARVNQLAARGSKAIGIVDRDFDGLLGGRSENLHANIIDTELHDSEMVMVDAGALQVRLETDLPPHMRRAIGVTTETMRELQRDALEAVSVLGAIKLANLRRAAKRDATRPVATGVDIEHALAHYNHVGGHSWKFDVVGYLQALAQLNGWTASIGKQFADEVIAVRTEAKKLAQEEMDYHEIDASSPFEAERYLGLLLGNGHDFMVFVSRAWIKATDQQTPPIGRVSTFARSLSMGLRDVFELTRFRRTLMFRKISEHCQSKFGNCIFQAAT